MNKVDNSAFLEFYHKTKVLTPAVARDIYRMYFLAGVEHGRKIKCTCDARFSGVDEAEYRARGCPRCTCEDERS